MNPVAHAVRVGLRRGWTEFVLSLRSGQDQGFYLFVGLGVLGYLWINRDSEVAGTDLLFPTLFLPSVLGGFLVFGMVIGPAFALVMEKEDGTLLRAKATPHGLLGYVTGQVVYHSLSLVPLLLVILVPSALLFDDAVRLGAADWLLLVPLVLLAMVAALPIGLILGALVPNTQKMGTYGFLPVIALFAISGIFFPMQVLWQWVQVVAQVFPMYWTGLAMRSVFLPDSAAALEITGTWRTVETFAVLGAWAVVGLLVATVVLRRMARRQSGSAVESARERAVQYVR